jgi:hypothetical protein
VTDFISVYEGLAPDDYCDRMIDMYEKLSASGSAWSGEEANGGVRNRKDFSWFFEREQLATESGLDVETNRILDQALQKYSDEYPSFAMNPCHSVTIKVQKTPPKGGFHIWHCEHSSHNNSAYRNLTWTIYLNDIPDGEGETEFLELGQKVQPKKGTVCLFPASWTHTHRGNPVYTCDKYIATGWYYLS